jgi:hypothetical protein
VDCSYHFGTGAKHAFEVICEPKWLFEKEIARQLDAATLGKYRDAKLKFEPVFDRRILNKYVSAGMRCALRRPPNAVMNTARKARWVSRPVTPIAGTRCLSQKVSFYIFIYKIGPPAGRCFVEFFTANIRNPNTPESLIVLG